MRWLVPVALLAVVACLAQEFKVRSKENAISTEDLIRGFEAPPVETYTLGAGDEITVDVWAHPELSAHHIVGPDGKITVPVAGVLAVAGMSREEAQKAIARMLDKYYSELAVTVRVDRYTSFRIYILGRVGSPGALQFESQPTLLDVITRAAALPIGGVGADKAGLGRCAVIRRDQMIWIDLKTLVSQGNLSLNIRLARNDLVYMPDAGDQLVYVLGEVQKPGAFRLTPDMSFLDAFSQAGGLNDDAAGEKIELVRSRSGAHQEISMKALLASPPARNTGLEEGDIIYVPKRGLAKFGYVLQKAGPITSFAILGSILK
jgi:polysaccharide export outer membrane protein